MANNGDDNVANNNEDTVLVGDGIDYSDHFFCLFVFVSRDQAIQWLKQAARLCGFDLIISSNKYSQVNGRMYTYLSCERGGKYRGKTDLATVKRVNTRTKKCGCPFKAVAVESAKGLPCWFVRCIKGTHNHELTTFFEGHVQRCKLSDDQKKFILEHLEALNAPRHIKIALQLRYPDQPHFNIRQIYNLTAKFRVDGREGRTHAQQLLFLAAKNGYVQSHEVNEDNMALTKVFLVHPEGLKMYRAYHYAVGMDTTFSTNPYGLSLCEIIGITPVGKSFVVAYALINNEGSVSFEWVLNQLRALLDDGTVPCTIVTDFDRGAMKAIQQVFPTPGTVHLLCRWHIMVAVDAKASLLMGKNSKGTAFIKNYWSGVMNAETEEEYCYQWERLETKYREAKPELISYLQNTWLEHKEKFVRCYTKHVMHLGFTSTSRVESGHANLKRWLSSATLHLDNVWTCVDKMINGQIDAIRNLLEKSSSTSLRSIYGGLFRLLKFRVSHYAISLMQDEYVRVGGLAVEGVDLTEVCGHALLSTHGLPCGCVLHCMHRRKQSVWLDNIHIFWKDLTYGVDGDGNNEATDEDFIEGLFEQVRNCDPVVRRRIAEGIQKELHPEDEDVQNPEIVVARKGRPKKPTTRKKSTFELVKDLLSGKGVKRKPKKTVLPDPVPDQGDSAPTDHICDPDLTDPGPSAPTCTIPTAPGRPVLTNAEPPWEVNYQGLHSFLYWDMIPEWVYGYLIDVYDPIGDGHCGFRVMSHAITGVEEHYLDCRIFLSRIIEHARYINVYDAQEYYGRIPFTRIYWPHKTPCGPANWMSNVDLVGYATAKNWVICVIGISTWRNVQTWVSSHTYLPLTAPPGASAPYGEMWFLHTGIHWIRLRMAPDCPMPPVIQYCTWNADSTVENWDTPYMKRLQAWNTSIENHLSAVGLGNPSSYPDPYIHENPDFFEL